MSASSKDATILRNANLRLCRLRMWTDYDGFGFNLETSYKLPYIHFVEPYSPAAAGGLKILDVILAINNQDTSSTDFNYVMNAIRHARDTNGRIELLVIEQHFYQSLVKKNIQFNIKFASIIDTPQTMPVDYQNYFKYQPRSCEIYLNKSDRRFGFDIANGENEIGASIETIHPNTPASQTLLRQNDRIIEINDKYVDQKVRKSICKKLDKARLKGYVKLYVMDIETYKYYQTNKISLSSKKYRKNQLDKRLSKIDRNDKNNHQLSNKYIHGNNRQLFSSTISLSSLFEEDIRLCTIIRADATDTFGIYLNYSNRDQLHSVTITPGRNNGPSNAELSGLNNNDCLIELNGENIENLDSEQVKQRFRAIKYPAPLQILVTNIVTYNYYKKQNKLIHHKLSTVQILPPNIPGGSSSYEIDKSDDNDEYFVETSSCHRDLHSDNNESYIPAGTIRVRKRCYLTSSNNKNFRPSINVCKGDLVTQKTDVIVVCSSSEYLFDNICNAGGKSVSNSYNAELNKNPKSSVITVKADGKIASKRIYFLPWKANSDTSILRKSIEKFVSDAIEKAAREGYNSIAFPAIGCGKFGCLISLIAQIMIEEADRQLLMHSVSVLFVIQPERMDIYNEFQNRIHVLQSQQSAGGVEAISTTIGNGIFEVEKGDITMQNVDVIIGSSSSEMLRKAIIRAAGNKVQIAYDSEYKKNPNTILISTPPGVLPCKRIFFLKWEPATDDEILQQSLIDLMSTVIQNMISYNFTSIAFPALGCGRHGCRVNIVVKTMVKEMRTQLNKRSLAWTVKFVVQPDQSNIYDEFCKEVLTTHNDLYEFNDYQLPSTWETSKEDKIRFVLLTTSDEYKSIVSNFDQAMKGNYTQIIRIERIQNARWYMQYLAHSKDFKKRLNMDTEKRLYHGCSEQAADSIIKHCFNRSFAGVNGTVYGVGVYFSSNAAYSHGYTRENQTNERCMFVARVLVGKTAVGNGSMKTPPAGFDSTTDGKHIFVTYHDAQAMGEYLITYK